MYEVELSRNAIKSLDKLHEPDYSRIISALSKLQELPRPKGVEKVSDTELWRVREGNYRLVYHINDKDKIITVVRIGHRSDVYRGL